VVVLLIKKFLAIALALALLGCVSQPASPTATPVATVSAQPTELPLEEATKAMIAEMVKSGGDVPTATVSADQGFSGEVSRTGSFKSLGYMTSGSATLQTKDGTSFVVFGEDFSTPNGPDIVVYLTKNSGDTTRDDIKAGLVLEKLKSTSGKQVYSIPAGTDVSQYNSVSLHCRAFNVPWSYASLK